MSISGILGLFNLFNNYSNNMDYSMSTNSGCGRTNWGCDAQTEAVDAQNQDVDSYQNWRQEDSQIQSCWLILHKTFSPHLPLQNSWWGQSKKRYLPIIWSMINRRIQQMVYDANGLTASNQSLTDMVNQMLNKPTG